MTPERTPRPVVTFGELMLSLGVAGCERLVQAREFTARYTGAEANTAVSLAHLGCEAFVVSRVPDHEIGQACVNYLRAFGVRTDYIVRGGRRLGLLYLETGASQRPSQVIYDRSGSSFSQSRREDFDWPAILAGKQWFHFSGTAPALGEKVRAVLTDALKTAQQLGLTVSCDCNYRSKLWSFDEAGRVLRELLPYVHVFVCGREDAEKLFGVRVNVDGCDSETIHRKTAEMLQRQFGLRCVAMTLREGVSASVNRWAALICDDRGCHVSRKYEIQIVDRIGAGDAFTAGLIFGMLAQFDPQKTVEFAAAAGCLKHTIPGDFNLVSRTEIENLLAGDQSGRVQR